jgi:hypothetical protein
MDLQHVLDVAPPSVLASFAEAMHIPASVDDLAIKDRILDMRPSIADLTRTTRMIDLFVLLRLLYPGKNTDAIAERYKRVTLIAYAAKDRTVDMRLARGLLKLIA